MNQPHPIKPPRWPLRFLRFFIRKTYVEEIEGDMEELFYDQLEHTSPRLARLTYTWEVLNLMRPALMQNLSFVQHINPYAMFRNYFKTSSRSLMKNPVSSFINVFGLAVAIGVCVVVYGFVKWTYSIDQFHEHKNEVYLATIFVDRDGAVEQYGIAPRPLGDFLQHDFAQIHKMCRIETRNVVMKQEDNVFHEQVHYADPTFLDMFTFPLKWGTPQALSDPSSVILSEETSIKYFGTENPIGRDILMVFGENHTMAFKVGGVAAKFPKAHAVGFEFLVNFENLASVEPGYDAADWKGFVTALFIQVDKPADLRIIEGHMEKYKVLQHAAQKDWSISAFAFEPLATLHENSGAIRQDISMDSPVEARLALPLIGLFMLVLACFNYINIAIVSATRRLKEIGVRKVIGANRTKVIVQFLTENIIITCFALALGIALGALFFVPWFVNLTGQPLEDITLLDRKLWLFAFGIMLFTSIASGLYPAIYISRFEAIKIFKGSLQFGKRNPVTKVFLGLQLMLACILMTGAVMFTQNTVFQNNQGWGYDQKDALYVNTGNAIYFKRLRDAIQQDPNLLSIAGSADHLGKTNTTAVLHRPDREYEVQQLAVGATYFQTLGLELKEGRVFREDYESDRQAVVVNALMVKNMAWEEPVGQQFEVNGLRYEVVGVVEDFHHRNFYYAMLPTMFTLAAPDDLKYLSVKVKSGSAEDAYRTLQTQWTKLFPEIPFDGGYQQDVWGVYFEKVSIQERFCKAVAFIAILLTSLGFYGIVMLNVSGRVKEFSIRKVLGARLSHIAGNITREYMVLAIVALACAAPISYILIKSLLTFMYAYHRTMDYSGVMIAILILIMILLATILTQVFKVSKASPVSGLKEE